MGRAASREEKAAQTTATAKAIMDSEVSARDNKTARLRQLRELRDAEQEGNAAVSAGTPPRRKTDVKRPARRA